MKRSFSFFSYNFFIKINAYFFSEDFFIKINQTKWSEFSKDYKKFEIYFKLKLSGNAKINYNNIHRPMW